MDATSQALAPSMQRSFQLFNPQRIGFLMTLATTIAVLFAGYMWSQTPDYRVVYGNLSDRDGGAVIAALQQMNIPYKFADGGALSVPSNQVHEVRLRLAGQGLPKGGLIGFELMESQKFGTSQFAEQINYQRGLEGELARSIQTLSSVQSARVHLALTKQSAFLREHSKPSASVVLGLFPGRTLDATQVSAVVHLISNSVPDLPVKNVSIVDQHGNLLSAERGGSSHNTLDPTQIKYRHDLEQSFISRIESIISPLTGPQNVRAQVTADLDFTHSEHAEEIYKPNQTADAAVRSKQTSESNAGGAVAGGVPGALSNQPPSQPTAPITATGAAAPANTTSAGAAGNGRKDATVNYEVDKTIRHTRQELGRVKRLAVAVVVNHRSRTDTKGKVTQVPLSEADIAKITNLVREVMGYNKERGDTVSVINSAFNVREKEKFAEVPLWKDPENVDLAKIIGKNTLIAAVLLFLVLGVLRPMLKSYGTAALALPSRQMEPTIGETQPQQLASYEQHVDQAKQIARADPKAVANVVKDWVASNGK
ncbi:MAG: flagellar basal-body MS-ring/collar protein FliF [Burkholderiales bacterium]